MDRAGVVVALALATGCVGISGIRNGPPRDRMRSATRVTGVTPTFGGTQIDYERVADVHDGTRPFGFGIGGKSGVAYGGTTATAHGGYAQDFTAFALLAFGRFYVAPQLGFFMNLHAGDAMGEGETALGIPLELEGGMRVHDRVALYAGGGRSLWGSVSVGANSVDASFWRGRFGTLMVVRNGSFHHFEITLRVEGFATTGGGDGLDYDAIGGLLQLDFTGTGSGY